MRLGRSTFSMSDDKVKQMEDVANRGDEVLKEYKSKLLPLAEALKVMVETDGWRNVVAPFLRANGNSDRLFGLTAEEYSKKEPTVKAYRNTLRLVENIVGLLKVPDKEE